MKKLSILFIAITSTVFFACKDNSKSTDPEVVTIDHDTEEVEIYAVAQNKAEFNNSDVEAAFEQYLQVQNALINTNGDDAAKESAKLFELIADREMDVDGEILDTVEEMSHTDNIEVQRKLFELLNNWMEKKVEGTLTSGTIYKQYCPMAFNDKGAFWLSTSKDILNPYFGDVMLKCGRVDSEIN